MSKFENPAERYATEPARTQEGARQLLVQMIEWTETARKLTVHLTPPYPNQEKSQERLELVRIALESARHHAIRS